MRERKLKTYDVYIYHMTAGGYIGEPVLGCRAFTQRDAVRLTRELCGPGTYHAGQATVEGAEAYEAGLKMADRILNAF